MDSALTPREIQSRIRAGESVDDVARAAGVGMTDLEGFAGPVMAEREHMTELARTAQARRDSGPTPQPLEQFIDATLKRKTGIHYARAKRSVSWDAFRLEDQPDRHWTVRIGFRTDDQDHEAHFDFDPRGRYVTAMDDDARWLIDDQPQQAEPGPAARTQNPDAEPTIDLNDDFAIVRAIQDEEQPSVGDGSALEELYAAAASNDATDTGSGTDDDGLREVDGVYDIVPNPTSDMDVLYDMLAGFDEDSVHVYEGLDAPINLGDHHHPAEPTEANAMDQQDYASQHASPAVHPDTADAHHDKGQDSPDPEPEPVPEQDALLAVPSTQHSDSQRSDTRRTSKHNAADTKSSNKSAAKAKPAAKDSPASTTSSAAKSSSAPKGKSNSKKKRSTTRRKGSRATVPSWDEIMFGERHSDKPQG